MFFIAHMFFIRQNIIFSFAVFCPAYYHYSFFFYAVFAAAVLKVLQSPAVNAAGILRQGLRAIVNLVVGNAANKTFLGENGACDGER